VSHDRASILLVEDDDDVATMVADYVQQTMRARVKRVNTASEAVRSAMDEHHDVVLADVKLPDCNDLELARELRRDGDCEIVLMTGKPTLGRALEAMRLGVRDMLPKPFDMHRLGHTLERAVSAHRDRHREQLRYDRLRRVSSRIIRERRLLKQRVDLVCRDLVGAYRRLAEKVVAHRDGLD
jgi:DNA-binding NtrC family response regulator